MAASLWLSWPESVSLSVSDGAALVAGPRARIALRPVAPEIVGAMRRLTPPGEDEEQLAESVLSQGSAASLARWYYHVEQLHQRGLIRRSLRADGRLLATLVPLGNSPTVSFRASAVVPGRCTRSPGDTADDDSRETLYLLSRFAYLRREGREMVLESPLAHCRVVLHDPRAVAVIGALGAPATVHDLAEPMSGLSPRGVSRLLSLLSAAGMVEEVTADALSDCSTIAKAPGKVPGEMDQPAQEVWEFHDLLFHSRSRRGRTDGRFGGTYRLAHRPLPPALKIFAGDCEWHALPRPDLDRLKRDDPSLSLVQERRRSLRRYAVQPISVAQLGEFLYRVGRVTEHWQSEAPTPSGPVMLEHVARPYPSGGGLYELEFYLAVKSCQDLVAGLYYYDPQHHRLGRRCGPTAEVESLLAEAASSAGIPSQTLQVLVILAARFERLAWKYESIAYALILKHVGVVYQTMYLAATAMDLAPCALGCGDSDLFARAAGTEYCVETSVGEFLLGSRE